MFIYLTKRETFNLNKNTIVVVIILFSLIFLSTYFYDLHINIVEGFGNDLDPVVKEKLEAYIKKENIFQIDGKEIDSQSGHPPGSMQVVDKKVFSTLYLRDFYIKSSFNSCAIDNNSDYVSELTLPILLRQGIRFFNFQVFNHFEENEPVIAINKIDDSDTITSKNNVSFSNAMNSLKRNGFTSSLPNFKDPLFIHINLCEIYDETILSKINKIIKSTFKLKKKNKKKGLDEFYYLKQSSKDPYVFNNQEHKRTFIFITMNYEDESNSINNLLKLENVYKTISYDAINGSQKGNVYVLKHSDLLKFGASEAKVAVEKNMQNFTICVPDKTTGDKPFSNYIFSCDDTQDICYPEPMLYGCQFLPACYNIDVNLAVYNNLFEKRIGSGFIVKKSDLRLPDIHVQSNTYKNVSGNDSANIDNIEKMGESKFIK